jgi:hypothetical protein
MKFIKNFEKALWVTASRAAEKLKLLSFRGTLRAEESLLLLTLEPREIPHFVRNDKILYFFRSLFSRDRKSIVFRRLWPLTYSKEDCEPKAVED